MTEQIIIRNVMRITEGRLGRFREAVRQAVDHVEQNGPQLTVRTFIDDDEMCAVSFQLYRNSDDILRHWQMSDPHIQAVSEHCTVEAIEIYGSISKEVEAGLAPFVNDGRGRIAKPFAGFSRF
ncbi:hypothetical protein [Bosea sp. BIWAKO-01]|uniref:hypothetical protein n=1 Tax=Bosea sp. BIWAKO-01 TaxID=506668 RepID=UPI000852B069|nr:hypothetical protein [Bosea sp. BIWAKO-01]GAU83027.1 hypothetical protein BIWAKO_02950 [Bosea sp. BIWAKO-01]